MAENRSDMGSRMGDQGQQGQEGMAGAVSGVASAAADMASHARDTVMDYGQKGYEMASEKTREYKETAEGYIHENPWYAIGIAVGVGVLLGMLLKSGRD